MFTGIVQTIGKIVSIKPRLTVAVPFSTKGVKMGESIAVDGCCLTVVRKGAASGALTFDVSGETLQKTTIGSYRPGQIVNLERAMKASDRFGGHFVTGHVDGVGEIKNIRRGKARPAQLKGAASGAPTVIEIAYPKSLASYLIDKGSVTVDGISLTVCRPRGRGTACRALTFIVYIVPHTAKVTNLSQKRKGDPVNLEMDILGKYVQALISRRR